MLAPEQRFGEHLVIPEGLYDQRLGNTDTNQVLVVNEGEQPLLLDVGRTMTGELVKPDLRPGRTSWATGHAAVVGGLGDAGQHVFEEGPTAQEGSLQASLWVLGHLLEYYPPVLVELQLRLKPGTQPIRQKFRNLNPRQEAELEAQLETWLAEGVIEPSCSAWSSPLVPIKKRDGSNRWAVD
jgi:hypothetical protein